MKNINFKSLLIENKQNTRTINYVNASQKNNGIDFKNDTLLIKAEDEYIQAQENETQKATTKNHTQIETNRSYGNYQNILNNYQTQLNLNHLAKISAENLNKGNETILEQLMDQNTKVANLENQKNNATNEVLTQEKTINKLTQEKEVAIWNHNSKINSLTNRKNNIEVNISKSETKLSNLKEVLSNTTDTKEKARIQAQITNIEKTIASQKAEVNRLNDEIQNAEQTKKNSVNNYHQLIQQSNEELTNKKANLENITNNLAQEVYTQTGLSLQSAYLKEQIKETQLFLQSTIVMLSKTEKDLKTAENENTKQNEKLNSVNTEYLTAQKNTDTKKETFEETKFASEIEYKSENKQFLA